MTAPARTARDTSIDLLRGAVMALMALDHARDFFHVPADPTDLATTTPTLFFTRWVTHFCAPVFVLLAGVSAWLSARGASPGTAARLLATRGLWLVVLELTVVRFGWLFNVNYRFTFVQVIWALGWSMVALAALSRLGPRAAGLLGVVMVAAHNLLDPLRARDFGALGWLWHVLHEPGRLRPFEGRAVYIAYPLVPWVGVMAAGYGLGAWLDAAPALKRSRLLRLGAALSLAFLALRAINRYGDPSRWSVQPRAGFTALSFLDCTKYPPSLLYLLMTLGPALLAWGLSLARPPRRDAPLVVIGRVPLFYYVLHLPLLHAMAGLWILVRGGPSALAAAAAARQGPGLSLPGVYLAWACALLVLWPASRRFDALKTRHHGAWWTRYV